MTTLDLITRADLEDFKLELYGKLIEIKLKSQAIPIGQWLKSGEVRKLLKISPGTLQSLRITGVLRYTKVGKMFYYKDEDITKILEDNKSDRKGTAL